MTGGVDASRFKKSTHKTPIEILTTSRFVDFKGIQYSLRAIAKLKELTNVPFTYRLIGSGPKRDELIKLIPQPNYSEFAKQFKENEKSLEEAENSRRIKSLFETYFDGCFEVEAFPNTPTTYKMGICKLEFDDDENILTVYLRRPGLLIGKAGSTIDALKQYLNCGVRIEEVKKF
jgi:glycosyltransferase involved in cell wall biosynthesis